ncbi:MAG: HD domain-containing protein [Clostridia bacterium]|nr:HD domain-containing protein [Clostridia bacterium]
MIPSYVQQVLYRLRQAGHAAYPVGGCVRDRLLGLSPKDWDVCISARPEETEALFADFPLITTGKKHGTVGVVIDHTAVEVTTFRRDGAYMDSRHPESVTFLCDVAGDLSRRDFTINAMALDEGEELIDPFGGQADLQNGILRAVGDPDLRFREDALRILRGLRFAARLGFCVEERTARAMLTHRDLLHNVSAERVFAELKGILSGPHAANVLAAFAPVIFTVLPELAPMAGFLQHSPYHDKDVWGHTLCALAAAPGEPVYLRLALLFHDCGKPACFTLGEDGRGHFYGHPQISARIAESCLRRLACDKATLDRVLFLIENHDRMLPETPGRMGRLLLEFGEEELKALLLIERCDALAHAPKVREQAVKNVDRWEGLLFQVLENHPVQSLHDLAISGRDLLTLGMAPGPELGRVLHSLLNQVAEGSLPNEKTALLAAAQKYLSFPCNNSAASGV